MTTLVIVLIGLFGIGFSVYFDRRRKRYLNSTLSALNRNNDASQNLNRQLVRLIDALEEPKQPTTKPGTRQFKTAKVKSYYKANYLLNDYRDDCVKHDLLSQAVISSWKYRGAVRPVQKHYIQYLEEPLRFTNETKPILANNPYIKLLGLEFTRRQAPFPRHQDFAFERIPSSER